MNTGREAIDMQRDDELRPIITVVAGLVERSNGHELLLVCQHRASQPRPYWELPGGKVERGEAWVVTSEGITPVSGVVRSAGPV